MPEVVETLPAGYSFAEEPGAPAAPGPAPVVVDELPEGYTVVEEQTPGLVERALGGIDKYLGAARRGVQSAIGMTGEQVGEFVSQFGVPGMNIAGFGMGPGPVQAAVARNVYDLATDPFTYAPFGALAKLGPRGVQAVKAASAAFATLSSAGAIKSAEALKLEIDKASNRGQLTPEVLERLVDTAVGAAGVAGGVAGYRGARGQGRALEAEAQKPAPAVREAISPEDAAIIERITEARRRGPEAVEDAIREVTGARQPEAPTPPAEPSAIRDPRVAAELMSPRQVAPEDLLPAREAPAPGPEIPPTPEAPPVPEAPAPAPGGLSPELARAAEEAAAAVPEAPPQPAPDLAGPTPERAGISVEELARGVKNYVVGPGYVEYLGAKREPGGKGLGNRRAVVAVKPDGTIEVVDSRGLSDSEALRLASQISIVEKLQQANPSQPVTRGSVNPAAGPEAGALVLPSGAEMKAMVAKAPAVVDEFVGTVAGATKAIPFGGDASVLLNQALKLGVIDPKGFVDAAVLLPKAAASPKAAAAIKARLESLDASLGGLMKDSGLDLAISDDVSMALRNKWANKVPGLKQYLGVSERGYSVPLASLRASTFLKLVSPHLAQGKTFASDPKFFKGYARLVNVLSGRGTLGSLEHAAGTLNAFFISPRNLSSKFQQFTMLLEPSMPRQAKLALLKAHAKFYSGYAALLTLAKLAGYAVETEDPLHPDFGKVRSGDLRIDLGTGDLAFFRSLAILKEGKRTRLSGERVRETPFETGKLFLANKLAPLARGVYQWSNSRSEAEKEKAFLEMVESMRPIFAGQDLVDLAKSDESGETKALFGGLAFLGGRFNKYPEPAALTPEDEANLRREEAAQDEAREIRDRTDLPPTERPSPKERATRAEKSLERARYLEQAMEALRRGDRAAAYRVMVRARAEDIDIDLRELMERLKRSASETSPSGELFRGGRP